MALLGWKRILVGTDFSPAARAALRTGQALARGGRAGVEIVHVVEALSTPYAFLLESREVRDRDEGRLEAARKRLERLTRSLRSGGVQARAHVRMGTPWREILKLARERGSQVICLGNSGRSRLARLLLGATAENVVRHSPVPVLVTRTRPVAEPRRVLVPVDFGEPSRRALEFALRRLPRTTRLDLLHVVPQHWPLNSSWVAEVADTGAIARDLRNFLGHLGRRRRVRLAVRLFGDPAAEILRHARRQAADLIMLSTHERKGLARALLGSVAEKVVRHADRPVLVLPGPGRGVTRRRVTTPVAGRRKGLGTQPAPAALAQPASERQERRPRPPRIGESELRQRTTIRSGRPWAPHAHPGRSGPAGRRGSGHSVDRSRERRRSR